MLFTRCPDCDTTFRITADALGKADGQVRCGRCACVFNAYSELREQRIAPVETEQTSPRIDATARPSEAADTGSAEATDTSSADAADTVSAEAADTDSTKAAEPGSAEGTVDSPKAVDPAAAEATDTLASAEAARVGAGEAPQSASDADQPADEVAVASSRLAVEGGENTLTKSMAPLVPLPRSSQAKHDISFGGFTVASIIEQLESSGVDDDAADAAPPGARMPDSDLSGEHLVNSVLERGADEAAPLSWLLIGDEPRGSGSSRRWMYGSIAAGVLLAMQLTHHFRADIAGTEWVGPLLQHTYALLGAEIVPNWHLEQYEIVDWVATAEPNASGQGSLKITARIQNKGPQAQPYPFVHVQLKDRWEEEIGNRIFHPTEYLSAPARSGSLMAPGATARAELEVVDPGPDAYGFELDVCIQAEAQSLRCSADAVFPSM